MMFKASTGLVSAVLAVTTLFASPIQAADLSSWGRGSIKDYHPAPAASPAGPCYFRADVGYSMSGDPEVSWPQSVNGTLVTRKVTNTSCQ